ncbi:MAG: dienelactone hydrolase family protein [Myxococcota bacterium]
MCDERTFQEEDESPRPASALSRREFGVLSVGATLAALLPLPANAAEVTGQDIVIGTPDGQADAYYVHPKTGKHPGVLMWPDAFGLRPAMKAMAKRLAASGYSVLVVNPYYRNVKAPLFPASPEGPDFSDPATRNKIMSMMQTLNAKTHFADAKTFIDYLDAQSSVATDHRIGTLGYCMGGPMTMRTAAARADRVGAAASFHGGRLVTDQEDSPHLLVPKIKANYLFAIAENDDQDAPEAKDVLRAAFSENRLTADIEVYDGTLHGWCPPDSRVYNEVQAERAWERLLALFENALGHRKA